jgi:hypothetical protein
LSASAAVGRPCIVDAAGPAAAMRSRGRKRRTSLEGIGIRNSRIRRSNWRTAQLGCPWLDYLQGFTDARLAVAVGAVTPTGNMCTVVYGFRCTATVARRGVWFKLGRCENRGITFLVAAHGGIRFHQIRLVVGCLGVGAAFQIQQFHFAEIDRRRLRLQRDESSGQRRTVHLHCRIGGTR